MQSPSNILAEPPPIRLDAAASTLKVLRVCSVFDVLALPSHYEELGSILIEGMQAGLPIVAADTGGHPRGVSNGYNGLLVPPGEPRELADALQTLLRDDVLRATFAENSARRAPLYDWHELAARVVSVYEGVVERQRVCL